MPQQAFLLEALHGPHGALSNHYGFRFAHKDAVGADLVDDKKFYTRNTIYLSTWVGVQEKLALPYLKKTWWGTY